MPARNVPDNFYVIAIGLPPDTRACLTAAFPHAILWNAAPDDPRHTSNLCDFLGSVVIFTYIPAISDRGWLRSSALFHQDAVKVIGVHPRCTDTVYDRALKAELAGVIDADSDSITYRRAALSVQRDELWFPRGYLSKRIRTADPTCAPEELSEREADVLALLGRGIPNQGIADKLFISRDTVRWHLRSIYSKLGVSDREAASRLAQNKLATAPDQPKKASA